MDVHDTYLYVIVGTIVLSMLIMIFMTFNNIVLEKRQKLRFCFVFALIAFIALLDLITYVADNCDPEIRESLIWLQYLCNYLGFSVSPLVPLLLARIAYSNKYSKLLIPLWTIHAIVMIFLVSFDQVFTFTGLEGYNRVLPGFIYYVAFYGVSILLLFIGLLLFSRKMIAKTPYLLFVLFIALIAGMLVQVIREDVHASYLIISIVSIIFYDYISSLWAQTDGLTGLFSQYTFIQRCKYIKHGYTIVFFDADNFKQVNDTYGHVEGDKVLQTIAITLHNNLGKGGGRCYRVGGDEFAAIIRPGVDIEPLISAFNEALKHNHDVRIPNVSYGYETYEKDLSIEVVKNNADQNMYLNKIKNKQAKELN